jgi:hypothetical protein
LYDPKENPCKWEEPVKNSQKIPLAGTGNLMNENDGDPVSWTGSLEDSKRNPIKDLDSLFDENGNPLRWESPSLDKDGKPIPGTGLQIDTNLFPVSWLGVSGIDRKKHSGALPTFTDKKGKKTFLGVSSL